MIEHKILLVSEDKGTRQAITILLQLNNKRVMHADDSQQAVQMLAHQQYSMVLCDCGAALSESGQLLQVLKLGAAHFHTPVIILADENDLSSLRQCMDAGADDFVFTPFTRKTLLAVVENRLLLKERQRQLQVSENNDYVFSLLNKNFNQELLTSLNGITNATVLLETLVGSEVIDGFDELVHVIHAASFRIQRTTQNLGMYAALQTANLSAQNKQAPLILNDILQLIVNNYEERDSTIPRRLDVNVVQDGTWTGNEEMIKVIFTELTDNGLKFSADSTPPIISLTALPNSFSFAVSNRVKETPRFGVEDIMPFKKFHDDLSRNGLGLGLYVCKAICSDAGFDLSFSVSGKQFTVSVESK